ncbi:uncharacterized protein LOC128259827 [Drosophila gunungcola]|uniref:BACK domain-containing protein n=1 Tax=Drosophila gunungcola TaxID=103775 RepID=A0A9P9YIY4_9MUSC|nr:uncharacterized protein LOC128259827 [Drosophila gunungcola]KAI8037818.1 hypothetical protein M5D96_009319 [Drosophila gunungcola]
MEPDTCGHSGSSTFVKTSVSDELEKSESSQVGNSKVKTDGEKQPGSKEFGQQQTGELKWKMFTDEEYSDWKTFSADDCKVPLRSFFSYVELQPSPVVTCVARHKKPVPQVLAEMIEGNLGAYIRIRIGTHKFRCIPNLLKCYSVWFANRDWRMTRFQFEERQVPARGFAALYEWMRTEKEPELRVAVPSLQAARHLQVHLFEKTCWTVLSGEAVREKVAFGVYLKAKRVPELADLCHVMFDRLRYFFLALVGSPEFLALEVDVLELILRRDSIGVNSEMEVFFAVLRWLGHTPADVPKRLPHMRRLMSCVRFHHLPMSFLFSLRESINRPDKMELFRPDPVLLAFNSDPEMMTMMEHALSFIAVRCQYEDTDEFLAICASHRIGVVFPRHWVCHTKCPYHQRGLAFPYQHRFTASDFGDYIAAVQSDWVGPGPADHGKSLVLDLDADPLLTRQSQYRANRGL